MEHLALYSRKCKTCKHLDPEEKVAHDKCHHTTGNTDCPAKEVQFAVVGEARRLADAMRAAQSSSDLQRQIKILEHVGTRSAAFQHKYKSWLQAK
jgi:hypothetical protein